MQVVLSKNAAKQYSRLPRSEQVKIKKKLHLLVDDPFAGKKLSGELSGKRSLTSWPYRIIYIFNIKAERVEVSEILHRQGAYK